MTVQATAVVDGVEFRVDFDAPHCIAVGLRFGEEQPNAFSLPRASGGPFEAGGFIGDTRQGGAVNCEVVTLAPHGNGTHTECVGHVVDERVDVHSVADPRLVTAALVTVPLGAFGDSGDSYVVGVRPDEEVVPAAALARALESVPGARETQALVIRTSPNPATRQTEDWSTGQPPFLTRETMQIVAAGQWTHVLLDLPSVDRAEDDGLLDNHRRWWGLAPGARTAGQAPSQRTITEMIYAADVLRDGLYALSLQVAPFVLDAAPSRPVLFPLLPSD